jgi:hypothetical protein
MKVGPVFFVALLPALLHAQNQASLGVGIGVVRHDNGSSFSAFTLSPAVQRLTPLLYAGATGGIALLDSSVWASQGRMDLWAARPLTTATKVALNVALGASTRSDGIAAGSGAALAEIVWAPPGAHGGGAIAGGAVTGVIQHVLPVTALRLRARTWWQPAQFPAQLSFTGEATRFLGAWYQELVAGASIERPRVTASLWLSARFSGTYGSTGAISALAQYFVAPRVAIEASAGNYLRDPFQGLPRAGFGSIGIRLHNATRALSVPPQPAAPALQPLIAQPGARGGDTLVVRFHLEGARTVAIAGSWNAWTPVPLQSVEGEDIWEAALRLPPGTYYFNLIVDGSEWVVPGGVAVVSDGMGGLVAVLTVL